MKKIFVIILLSLNFSLTAQSLINSYSFPSYNPYNYFWGITHIGNDLWIATDYDGTSYPFCMMYKVSKTGVVLDSVTSPFKFNHGLAWDGTNFWWGQDYFTSGAKIYKISPAGIKLDSIILPSLNGGASSGLGDIEIRGNNLWFALYSPDFTTYPNAYTYVLDLSTRLITDTIPMRGRQVQGITVKGDTVFYVNDNFHGDPEKIYAFRKSTGDTIFSFRVPDPDNNCNPKGLHWDGQYLWLIAERVGGTSWVYKTLYKYDLSIKGWSTVSTVTALPFGDVTIGSPQNQQLTVNNTGDANLKIDSIKINNSVFSFTPTNFPHNISAGEGKNYTVTFNPSVFGDQTAEMKIYSNDPVNPTKVVTLTGRGVFGTTFIQFSSEDLNFNGKRKNSTSYIELKIYNKGTQTLTVDSLSINNPNFYLRNYTLPITIPYTDSSSLKVWFKPTQWSNYLDTIKVYSTASNGAIKKIFVRGFTSAYDSTLGSIIWAGVIPDNPNTSSDDYTARYLKKIKDINGDNVDDIIAATDNYYVVAFNGNSSGNADILWTYNLAPNNNNTGNVDFNQGLQFIDDISGDNINDVVVGTAGGGESVIAINGVTGKRIWEFGDSVNYNNGDVWAVDVKRDFNNDGKKDVLASVSGNESTGQGRFSVYCLNGMTGDILWQINQSSEWKLKYAIASTDDGGAVGSRIAGGNPGQVICFNKQGQIVWTYNSTASPWGLIEISNIGGSSTSDLIAGGFDGKVYALAGNNGQLLWEYNLGSVIIEDLFLSPDVNGNGYPDILVSALTPNCFLIDGFTGTLIWSASTGGNNLGAGVLGDLNGDLKPEVASSDLGNLVKVFNGTNGNNIFTYPFGSGGNSTAAECVWIADDVDKNNSFEFVAGSRDGRVVLFSGGLNGTIPVEMNTFYAGIDGKNVNLNWTTITEKNNKGFEIEKKSFNSSKVNQVEDWKAIGFVNGNGTTSEKQNYSFIDKNVSSGKYSYRLKQIDFEGSYEYSKVVEIEVGLPINFALEQNFPNPFNPQTKINYQIPVKSFVSLKIFDILGREVATLVNEEQQQGRYTVLFDGSKLSRINNTFGDSYNSSKVYASGVYFYQLKANDFISTKKLIILK